MTVLAADRMAGLGSLGGKVAATAKKGGRVITQAPPMEIWGGPGFGTPKE